jgi:hypothetical protein
MDNVNYHPRLLLRVVNDRLLAGDPFMLFDIGCGLGLDPVWRFFADHLHAHAFDPQQAECAKLAGQEKNSHVRYHAAFVGLPPGDAFHAGRAQPGPHAAEYFSPSAQMIRGSSFAANARKPQPASHEPPSSLESTEQWSSGRLSTRTIAIDEFVAEHDIANIDFVKIDTDGRDLEAAFSCRAAIRRTGILGFMVECFFTGSRDATENSFHNVDAFMRENGFVLYALTANKYSRAALPAPFLYPALYQTISGQAVWGDMIYLRDGASKDYATVWDGDQLSATKLLKLACLYELFQLPDCAAELLVCHGDRVRHLIDPAILLDLLTPPLGGVNRSYAEYLQLFEKHVEAFFPAS